MCGIAGWVSAPDSQPPPEVLERMAHRIAHRGPDDSGAYRDPAHGVAIAHLRLSIIDLSAASHQPMIDEATKVVLAYNGELYNFRELRSELQSHGHSFRSEGDTEVVLRSYLEWGIACLSRFAGMFALVMWDARSGALHLARDPMGMKPMYYTRVDGGIAFASEVKAFKALPGASLALSQAGLQEYMEFGYVFEEDQTIFEGVFKVPPGQRLELRADKSYELFPYYEPPTPDSADTRGEAERVDELADVLGHVTAEHLIADVPLGLLLSGGLDSSVIAALAARHGPLLTISMGFSDSGVDERPQARAVSEYIGSRHLELLITPQHVMDEVERGAWVFDDLFADWGTVTTRLMYRGCREQGVKVILVGEGSDELFGGYHVFNAPQRKGLWSQFQLYRTYAGRRHGRLFGRFHRIFGDYLDASGGDTFHAIRLFETRRQLPNQYVMKVDKASMAESVEARAPFLDRRVADVALRTPREWLLRNGENKYLLRALARRDSLLPPATASRPKFGASVASSWMDDNPAFRDFAQARLLEGQWGKRLGLADAMRSFFLEGREGAPFPSALSIYRNVAWRLLLLEVWAAHYLGDAPLANSHR
jgi:asparagine synthase (glutamine-hydrolysing)